VCLIAPIFTSARACGHQALARTPSEGTTHHVGDPGLLGWVQDLKETFGEDPPLANSMPATEAHMMIIVMLWRGRSCRGRQCWLSLRRGPASAPKLRQNRIKCRATTGDWTGVPGIIQYQRISPPDPQVFTGLDLSAARHLEPHFHLLPHANPKRSPSELTVELRKEMKALLSKGRHRHVGERKRDCEKPH
jgi:hypothetical protein